MSTGELCSRIVVVAGRNDTAATAADLMRRHHVGDVVVVDETDGARRPLGIVTDRDIVVEVVATRLDAEAVFLGDIMSEDLVVARESDDASDILESMRRQGVRRAPVVDAKGSLVGILAIDDVMQFLAEQMGDLSSLIRREQEHEARMRR